MKLNETQISIFENTLSVTINCWFHARCHTQSIPSNCVRVKFRYHAQNRFGYATTLTVSLTQGHSKLRRLPDNPTTTDVTIYFNVQRPPPILHIFVSVIRSHTPVRYHTGFPRWGHQITIGCFPCPFPVVSNQRWMKFTIRVVVNE